MRISILTLFPDMFRSPFEYSILKRAISQQQLHLDFHNIRAYSTDKYQTVDDRPYGGGAGMVLRVDILDRALTGVLGYSREPLPPGSVRPATDTRVILLDPQGEPYRQAKAAAYAKLQHLVLICGHYEGFDERIRWLVDEEVSVGDFILTGGEIPAMAIIDSVTRLLPGVLPKEASPVDETFAADDSGQELLEYPHYTRPPDYKGMTVPEVLVSGNHRDIENWRTGQRKLRTRERRPDLIREQTDLP